MKNFLAGLLAAIMALSPVASEAPASSDAVTMEADGEYEVMPLSDISDLNLVSISDLSSFSSVFSRYKDESGNFILPFTYTATSKDDLSSYLNLFSDSYYVYGVLYKVSNKSYLRIYGIPKSNYNVISVTTGGVSEFTCPYNANTHTHYVFSPSSGDNSDFLWFRYSFTDNKIHIHASSLDDKAFPLLFSCRYSYDYQVSFFDDDSIFSSVSSSIFSNLLQQNFVSDISLVKFKSEDTGEIFDFPSSSSFSFKYTLTVNYLYSENNPAAEPVTQELAAGEEYSIQSPEIEGYTPSIPLVTGTMPDEDLTIDVYYSKAFYPLTVKYQYQDGRKAAEDVTFQYPMGFAYDIQSPEIEGYIPDKQTVSGIMPGKALEEVVTYSPISYTLSISYQYEDGTQAAEAHREQLTKGAAYSVTSPTITGYKPDREVISGTMSAKDTYFTVVYKPDPGGGTTGGGSGGGDHEGDGDEDGDGDDDDDDSGGNSGGTGSGGGWTGNDPFIPSQPPFSGYDPFDMSGGLPGWSGYDPFVIWGLPPYTYDPFVKPGG